MLPFPAHNTSSRAWSFYVNVLAASPLLRNDQRGRAYRAAGVATETDYIGPSCYFHSDQIRLGPGTTINNACHFENIAMVTIGANCGLAIHTTVLTSHHERGTAGRRYGEWSVRPVTIGDGSWIGARAIILPGVTIGEGCVIGAGAVVNRDCDPHGLYAGVPARRIADLPV